jgi:hypothetical protein
VSETKRSLACFTVGKMVMLVAYMPAGSWRGSPFKVQL